MQPVDVTFTTLRNMLLDNIELPGLLRDVSTNDIKIGAETISDGYSLPYIQMKYMYGGDTNKSAKRMTDITIRVAAIANDSATAEMIAGYIDDALTYKTAKDDMVPNDWKMWAPVTNAQMHSGNLEVKNNSYPSRGAFYRVRLVK